MALANGYLRFAPPQQQQDPFAELLRQQPPSMPGPMPARAAMPQRPRQSWTDVIPQLFSAAGDVVGAGAGIRTNYLPNVMGMQQGMRDRSFHDQLSEAAMAWDNQKMGYEDQWRRYGAQAGQQDRGFNRAYKMKEMDMFQKLADQQRGDVSALAANQKREQYSAAFLKAGDRQAAKVIMMREKAMHPEDGPIIDEAFQRMSGALDVEEAEAARPGELRQYIKTNTGFDVKKDIPAFKPRWLIPGLGTAVGGSIDFFNSFGKQGLRGKLEQSVPQDYRHGGWGDPRGWSQQR